jgi:hypothetical protein
VTSSSAQSVLLLTLIIVSPPCDIRQADTCGTGLPFRI